MNEQEWLQTATTEQLAEFLKKVSNYEGICTVCTGKCVAGKCIYSVGKQGWVEWLKQPHHEKE